MRTVAALLLLSATALAFDSVLFSSQQTITEDTPSFESLIGQATPDAPAVIFVTPVFTLGHFSKAAATKNTKPSALVAAARAAKSAESRYIENSIVAAGAKDVRSAADFKKGAAVYLVHGDNWHDLDELASTILAAVTPSVVIITNEEAVSEHPRAKRVAMSKSVAGTYDQAFPVVLPKIPDDASTCLFYLEGLNIVYSDGSNAAKTIEVRTNGTTQDPNKWSYDKSYATCAPLDTANLQANYSQVFIVDIQPDKTPDEDQNAVTSAVTIKLTFTVQNTGDWAISKAELLNDISVDIKGVGTKTAKAAVASDVSFFGADSVFGWGWNCWDTPAIFFPTDTPNIAIGVGFHGIQVQTYAVDDGGTTMTYFRTNTESCTGTFSVGSWMGIVSALVMVGVLLFGYLMLQSVQTQDRYDDPKVKQITINVRE